MRSHTNLTATRVAFSLCAAALLGLTGCHVDANKTNGNDKVNISTPFGGMSVKTNEDAVGEGVGLAVYPGATIVKKNNHDRDKDSSDADAADINMTFGSFHLGVKALSYQSQDDPAKVLTFYRKEMTKFGTVIDCKGNRPVSKPDTTPDGLTCADDDQSHPHVHIDEDSDSEVLKAGSRRHQHIVSVSRKDGGTRLGLVALDLPGKFINGDSDSQ